MAAHYYWHLILRSITDGNLSSRRSLKTIGIRVSIAMSQRMMARSRVAMSELKESWNKNWHLTAECYEVAEEESCSEFCKVVSYLSILNGCIKRLSKPSVEEPWYNMLVLCTMCMMTTYSPSVALTWGKMSLREVESACIAYVPAGWNINWL